MKREAPKAQEGGGRGFLYGPGAPGRRLQTAGDRWRGAGKHASPLAALWSFCELKTCFRKKNKDFLPSSL